MKKRTALALVTLVFNLSLVERLHAGGSFSTTGSLATYRDRHTATYLPNGKVLVVGGLSGPFLGWVALSSAELYDPAAATWTNTGSLASLPVPLPSHVNNTLQLCCQTGKCWLPVVFMATLTLDNFIIRRTRSYMILQQGRGRILVR